MKNREKANIIKHFLLMLNFDWEVKYEDDEFTQMSYTDHGGVRKGLCIMHRENKKLIMVGDNKKVKETMELIINNINDDVLSLDDFGHDIPKNEGVFEDLSRVSSYIFGSKK